MVCFITKFAFLFKISIFVSSHHVKPSLSFQRLVNYIRNRDIATTSVGFTNTETNYQLSFYIFPYLLLLLPTTFFLLPTTIFLPLTSCLLLIPHSSLLTPYSGYSHNFITDCIHCIFYCFITHFMR